jgi:hypothetical protein
MFEVKIVCIREYGPFFPIRILYIEIHRCGMRVEKLAKRSNS